MHVALKCLVLTIISLCGTIDSYPYGPPTTDYICQEMFPVGHGTNAQFTEPPFEIKLTKNIYSRGYEDFRVTLQALHGYFIGGFLIQARRAANCDSFEQKQPVGFFELLPGERYLTTMNCYNKLNSSLSHKISRPLDHAVFKWHAPARLIGHIYLVATVVKERTKFWTTVYSEIIRDTNSSAQPEVCPARIFLDPENNYTTSNPWQSTTPTPKPVVSGCGRTKFVTTDIVLVVFALVSWLIRNL